MQIKNSLIIMQIRGLKSVKSSEIIAVWHKNQSKKK